MTDAQSEPIRPYWSHDNWFEDASSWLHTALAAADPGYTINGPIERFFASTTSSILRVPTTRGVLYLKESAPLFHYEPALTATISHIAPAHSPHVLLIDKERCYTLMEDVGPTLKERTQKHRDLQLWLRTMPVYAQFQAAMTAHTALLKAWGCPDRSLSRIPMLFNTVLTDTQTLLVGQPGGISATELDRLYAFKPQLVALCQELASYGIPETLHHDDLTAGNVAIDDQRTLFFDWAESAITHPFCSLFIFLRVARYIFEFDEDELARIHDTYLQAWTGYHPLPALHRAFELAQRLAILSRALTWHYIVTHLPESQRAEYRDAPAYWLLLFLNNGVEPDDD
jgi:hypothetical protein